MLQISQVHHCTTQQTTFVLMFLKKNAPNCHWGGKKTSCLKNQIIPERSAAEIYCLSTAKITKKTGKTRPMSQCQRLQIKLQVGAKHRTGIKSLLKTFFQKKGDPFWTLSRKDWNNLPYFFPRKYDHKQINNKATQQPWKMEVFFKCLIRKIKAKILQWKLLQTSFCAAHSAITKCTPLKPTQSQEYQPGKMH